MVNIKGTKFGATAEDDENRSFIYISLTGKYLNRLMNSCFFQTVLCGFQNFRTAPRTIKNI